MKENEIMIGDWVRYRYNDGNGHETVLNFRVDQLIRRHNLKMCVYSDTGDKGDVSQIEPIPLTAKILENNEFVLSDGWWINERFPTGLGFISVAFDPDEEGRKTNTIYDLSIIKRESGSVDLHLNYVHELQHALRLCGIEKEITL